MKTRNYIGGAVLLALLSLNGWAADNMKATIRLFQSTTLGSTHLAAGEYKMTWQGTGPQVEVTLSQGNKGLVTVPAQVVQERSGYSTPVIYTNSATNTLTGINLPHQSFTFTNDGGAASGN
jgi:hypothetical protein